MQSQVIRLWVKWAICWKEIVNKKQEEGRRLDRPLRDTTGDRERRGWFINTYGNGLIRAKAGYKKTDWGMKVKRGELGGQTLLPYSIKGFWIIKDYNIGFHSVSQRGWPCINNSGRGIVVGFCLAKTILGGSIPFMLVVSSDFVQKVFCGTLANEEKHTGKAFLSGICQTWEYAS